jgi:hypothetical protein
MNNQFTDEQMLRLNEYGFNGNQINRLEALHLDLDDIYDNIRHIIDAYPPDPSDLEIRLSNEILIRLLENEYSFEEIESLLEYNLIDEDFEWLLDNPEFVYEDIYHLLEDGLSFNEIKNELEAIPYEGGKRRKKYKRKSKRKNQRKSGKQRKSRKQRKSVKRRKLRKY